MLPSPPNQSPSDEFDIPDDEKRVPEALDPVSDTTLIDCLPLLFSSHERLRSSSPQVYASDCYLSQSLVCISATCLTNLLSLISSSLIPSAHMLLMGRLDP